MNVGDKVIFWLDTRPLLDMHGFSAEVVGMSPDGARASVSVMGPRGRFSAQAAIAERAAPGVVTAEGVTAASQHEPDDRTAAESGKKEEATKPSTRRGSSGGSAAPAAETA